MITLNFYLYGDQAAGTPARETPLWEAWIQERFPTPSRRRARVNDLCGHGSAHFALIQASFAQTVKAVDGMKIRRP